MTQEEKFQVEDFEYLVKPEAEVIGILVADKDNYTLILKPLLNQKI